MALSSSEGLYHGCTSMLSVQLNLSEVDCGGCMVGSVEVIKYVDLSQVYVSFQYYIFNTLLITLLVIHLYWWVLILRMLVKQFKNRGKVGDDVRSGSSLRHSQNISNASRKLCIDASALVHMKGDYRNESSSYSLFDTADSEDE